MFVVAQRSNVSLQQTGDFADARFARFYLIRSQVNWALGRHKDRMGTSRQRAALLSAGTALLTSGCYLHTYVRPMPTYVSRAPTCVEAVTVFADAAEVRAAYEPLAQISVWHPADMRSPSPSFVQAAQRKRAAALGANGLILGYPIDQHQSFDAKTVAIFIRADSARARSVCALKRN